MGYHCNEQVTVFEMQYQWSSGSCQGARVCLWMVQQLQRSTDPSYADFARVGRCLSRLGEFLSRLNNSIECSMSAVLASSPPSPPVKPRSRRFQFSFRSSVLNTSVAEAGPRPPSVRDPLRRYGSLDDFLHCVYIACLFGFSLVRFCKYVLFHKQWAVRNVMLIRLRFSLHSVDSILEMIIFCRIRWNFVLYYSCAQWYAHTQSFFPLTVALGLGWLGVFFLYCLLLSSLLYILQYWAKILAG